MSFKCHRCDKTFDYKTALKIHYRKNHDLNILLCHKCDKAFSNEENFVEHLQKEHLRKNEKPFPCKICDKVCLNEHNLKNHVKNIHEKAAPRPTFPCENCNKIFASKKVWRIMPKYVG